MVKVSEQIYKIYWREKEHEKYLEQMDKKNNLFFFSDLSTEYSFEDTIADENYDLKKNVETKMLIDKVREAIDSLNDEEREVIERLYYQDESLRSIAISKKISALALFKRRNKILKKLKELLNDLM